MAWLVLPRRWSIRAKSVGLFIAYVLTFAVVYGAFSVHLVQRETAVANDQLQQTARMVAADVNAYVRAGMQRLATVAHLPGLVFGLRTMGEKGRGGHIPAWTTLHYIFFRSPVLTGGVFLLDESGTVVWTEPPGLSWVGQDLSGYTPLADVYDRGIDVVTGRLDADRLTADPHVVLATTIKGPDGDRVGVLAGVINLAAPQLTGILQAMSTDHGRFVTVRDAQEAELVATERPHAGTRADPPLLATVPLADVPWHAVAGQSRAIALADIHRLQLMLLLIGAVLALAALAVGVFAVRRFMSAIDTLTHNAQVMAGGDLSQPVLLQERFDEIGTLGRTFEQMRVELQRSHTALTQRLEERDELMRLKEEFLANVSHELRTPLNVIMGYTDMLLEQDAAVERPGVLQGVRAQSEHLFSLVCDLMTLSGLNTGKIAVDIRRVSVGDIIGPVRQLADRLGRNRDIAVVWEEDGATMDMLTDGQRLEQILSNLVTNAFKFTAHGTITISVRHDPTRDVMRFAVADTGIGIPAHEIPHIFDEFRQVDGSMSRGYGGIGLGLALVHRLATLLHGELSVVSKVNEGSCFTVMIPRRMRAVEDDLESERVRYSA
jgi:signal transduction histidine kinase